MVGMDDDEFNLDRAAWQVNEAKQIQNVVYNHYIYAVGNAFAINWPYISFSGLDNDLTILNTFDIDVSHRVIISTEGEEINICATFISDTRDLFTLVHRYSKQEYVLYKLDLDNCNPRENSDSTDLSQMYKNLEILKYSEEAVNSKNFSQIHLRGSSAKEHNDFNEELVLVLLHENELYICVWRE